MSKFKKGQVVYIIKYSHVSGTVRRETFDAFPEEELVSRLRDLLISIDYADVKLIGIDHITWLGAD